MKDEALVPGDLNDSDGTTEEARTKMEWFITIVATVVIAFFLLAAGGMYLNLESDQWDRMVALLGLVQTVALVAAGFLFGKDAVSKIAKAIWK